MKDLIVRVMGEANDEAEHGGWCDTELAASEQKRTKRLKVNKLHVDADQLKTSIAKLTEEVADLTSAMTEATKFRHAKGGRNAETVKGKHRQLLHKR